MAAWVFVLNLLPRRRLLLDKCRSLLFVPTSLVLLISFVIFCHVSSTSRLLIHLHNDIHLHEQLPPFADSLKPPQNKQPIQISLPRPTSSSVFESPISNSSVETPLFSDAPHDELQYDHQPISKTEIGDGNGYENTHQNEEEMEIFHDEDMFMGNYKEMNKSMKIYVYPHRRDEAFANVLLPCSKEPGGNYASESYFKKALMQSHFITKDPSEADFFFLPFSIAGMRNDKRIGVGGIPDFVKGYVHNISQRYPFWNRTGGADHFYVACHSIGKVAMDKAAHVKDNAIQVVCTSNYFVAGYVAHKDVSLPQIWPRQGDPPLVHPSKRKRLAFFAGAINNPARQELVKEWKDDEEIFAHKGRLKTPYAAELLRSKFCLHVKGFEVNTARIGDALYHGCVPVVLADYYDLPFSDILNWKSFSVVVSTSDIPSLKKILKGISSDRYLRLQNNVEKVRRHFLWHSSPLEFDAFHMVMYELWMRRGYASIYS